MGLSDFTFIIPDHYHAIRDLAGKEVIACAKDCKAHFILSPLNVLLGRQPLPGEVSPEIFTSLMIEINKMTLKMFGGGSSEIREINGVPAVVAYTDENNIVHVSIYHIDEYYQLRITFNADFNNKKEIAQKIFESFLVTDMEKEGTLSHPYINMERVQANDNEKKSMDCVSRGLSSIAAISAGGSYSLVLLENGDVYSFGDGSEGPLGHGDNENRLLPTKIETLSGVKAISAGRHSLVLLENGDVYSFGYGKFGQLGHGNGENQLLPTKIEMLSGVQSISAGGFHSLVLLENGDVYSFGDGNRGRLGHGDPKDRKVPTKIEALCNAKKISAGRMHSLVLLKNGDVYSFGAGEGFRLGQKDHIKRLVPTKIEGLAGVKEISAGSSHSLVLLENGDVYSFGDGTFGALGHGNKKKNRVPTKIASVTEASAIAAGDHASIVLLENGQVYSWGNPFWGVLGYGGYEKQLVPRKIANISDAIAISTCSCHSMILLNNGEVYSCGWGLNGRLGHGDEEDRYTPTQIEGFPKVAEKEYEQSHKSSKDEDLTIITAEFDGDFPVTVPPEYICAFHRQSYAGSIAINNLMSAVTDKINIAVNKGVDLSMEAVKVGIHTPPYDNKNNAWEFARVFRVDDEVFKSYNDREVEIQQAYLKNVAYLSALRSFAWTLKGYVVKKKQGVTDVPMDEILSIAAFIEERSFLNYTTNTYFPALCGVADNYSAYVSCSQSDPRWEAVCEKTGCESCGDLFALRSELNELTPVMAKIREHLEKTRTDATKALSGTLSDILYAWCSLSLAADKGFRIVDGTMSYEFQLKKGGVEKFSLHYWEEDEDSIINSISYFEKTDFDGTYFEVDLVGTGYEGRAPRFEYMQTGDQVNLVRNPGNLYDSNAINVTNKHGESLGHIPKYNASILAPAIDGDLLHIDSAEVLSVEPLSKRSSRAKNPLMRIAVRVSYY